MILELLNIQRLVIKSVSIKEIIKCLEILQQEDLTKKIKLRENYYYVDIYANRTLYKKIKRFVLLNRLITLDVYRVNEVEIIKDYAYCYKCFDLLMIAELIEKKPVFDSKEAVEIYFLYVISKFDQDLYTSLKKIKSSILYQDLMHMLHQKYIEIILYSKSSIYEELIHKLNYAIHELERELKENKIGKFKNIKYTKYKSIVDIYN